MARRLSATATFRLAPFRLSRDSTEDRQRGGCSTSLYSSRMAIEPVLMYPVTVWTEPPTGGSLTCPRQRAHKNGSTGVPPGYHTMNAKPYPRGAIDVRYGRVDSAA